MQKNMNVNNRRSLTKSPTSTRKATRATVPSSNYVANKSQRRSSPKSGNKRWLVFFLLLGGFGAAYALQNKNATETPTATAKSATTTSPAAAPVVASNVPENFAVALTDLEKKLATSEKLSADPALVEYTFIKTFTPEKLASMRQLKQGKEFLAYLFAGKDVITKLLTSGSFNNPERTLELFYLLFANDEKKELTQNKIYENLAIAVALNAIADNFQAWLMYATFNKYHKLGQLHKSFNQLTPREMRFLVDTNKLTADDIPYLLQQNNRVMNDYGGTCWYPQYQLENVFGDSIHGALYYRPWDHAYSRYEGIHKVFGVCGSLSHYGSASAKAHGVLSTPGGQPAHCAFVVRHNDGRWYIHYNVGAYTGAHFAYWNLYSYGALDLIEAAFKNLPAYIASCRDLWAAEYLQDMATKTGIRIVVKKCDVYNFSGNRLPDFANLTPIKTLKNPKIDCFIAARNDNHALVFSGNITSTKNQIAELYLASDDGSRLEINGAIAIDNDGLHGMEPRKEANIELKKGDNPFVLQYFHGGGERGLDFNYKKPSLLYDETVNALYKSATQKCPTNYEAWQKWGNYLRATKAGDNEVWQNWGWAVAQALIDYQEFAWQLINNFVVPELKNLPKPELKNYLLKCHQLMPESPRPTAEKYEFASVLNHNYKALDNDKEICIDLFGELIKCHDGGNNYFSAVMNWGSANFLGEAKYAKQFVDKLDQHFSSKTDKGGLANFLSSAIRKTSENGDIALFQQLCDLNDKLAPPTGGFIKGKGKLISSKGLLQTSSSAHENSLNYRRCIDDTAFGSFHTGNENNPWAIITLPGEAMVEEIYLRNVCSQNNGRSVPLVVSVSLDKQKWEEVFRTDQADNEWYIELKNPLRAKYIKAERPAGVRNDFFHLTKFQVYGKTLY